jgi:peptidyl-prolyl cis-trans isomerase D
MREDTARALLQTAIVGAIRPPQIYADSIAAFQGETRDLSILTLTEADLPIPCPSPRRRSCRPTTTISPSASNAPRRGASPMPG